MEKLKPVTFSSASSHPVRLEGVLHLLEGEGQWPAAVICHPHPLGGGTMHNSVVTAIARALVARGVLALRFNFRGTGRSGGLYDGGRGEQADVAGAMDWLLAQPEVDPWRVSLVGYSFGAWVGLMHAQSDPRVAAAAAVGLVAWHYDAEFAQVKDRPVPGEEAWTFGPGFLQTFTRPKLFVAGEYDSFSPLPTLRRFVEQLPAPKQLHVVSGTDHFFQGREPEVGAQVAGFIAGL
jgi:alpha/beta superfamily hydrolase